MVCVEAIKPVVIPSPRRWSLVHDTSTARRLSLLDITLLAVAVHGKLQLGGEAGVTTAAAAVEWVSVCL